MKYISRMAIEVKENQFAIKLATKTLSLLQN